MNERPNIAVHDCDVKSIVQTGEQCARRTKVKKTKRWSFSIEPCSSTEMMCPKKGKIIAFNSTDWEKKNATDRINNSVILKVSNDHRFLHRFRWAKHLANLLTPFSLTRFQSQTWIAHEKCQQNVHWPWTPQLERSTKAVKYPLRLGGHCVWE